MPTGTALCLNGERFRVEVEWRVSETLTGVGQAVPLSDDTGYFWFFIEDSIELIVKVLDGRPLNGRFWVFYGALSNVEYTITVTDTESGAERSYFNPQGQFASAGDTAAFEATVTTASSGATPDRDPEELRSLHLAHGAKPGTDDEEPDALSEVSCQKGLADIYPCGNVDLLSVMPLSAIGGEEEGAVRGTDIWGWTDPETGVEYALMGLSNGTSFIDLRDPEEPVYLGRLPTETIDSGWRDIKVYRDYAFIVADDAADHGMQIFDLRRLRDVDAPPTTFSPTAHYDEFGSAHNLAINEESGFAYAVGSDTCAGGLHMIDVRNPLAPTFAGCFSDDGYTHDAQCVLFHGRDRKYNGREICFNSNEDTLTIVDVTNKDKPVQLSRTSYEGVGYTHQGWLTDEHVYFLLDDEADEKNDGHNTRTYIWDVSDLDAPRVVGTYTGSSPAVDHNQFVHKGLLFQANYRSGLRILDLRGVHKGKLKELAFFDIAPMDDQPRFSAAWGVYPFFASGAVLVSGMEQGLYVLRPRLPGFSLPAAPSNLTATLSGLDLELRWHDSSIHEDGYQLLRGVNGAPPSVLAEVPGDSTSFVDPGLDPGTLYEYEVLAFNTIGESPPSRIDITTPVDPGPCSPGPTALCLNQARFQVEVSWRDFFGNQGQGQAQPVTGDSGTFWFFARESVEVVVKILDGRSINDRFWVFYGGLSNVEYLIRVIDTETGSVKIYLNPEGQFASVGDTAAF